MNLDLLNFKTYTIEEFQQNFDYYMSRVEDGESFIIQSKYGNVALVPYNESILTYCDESNDEFFQMYNNHEEGS